MTNPQQAVKNRAASYALRRGCKLLETPLGVGKDGIVFATSVATAIKAHRAPSSFRRELSCYQRLFEHHVLEVCGHAVPQLLNWSDDLLTIEMTIVTRPFLLDFSDAWLETTLPSSRTKRSACGTPKGSSVLEKVDGSVY